MKIEFAAVLGGDLQPPHRPAVALIGEEDVVMAVPPILAPLAQREHHREQRLALGGQRIDDLAPVVRVGGARQDSALDHPRQPVGQDVARDPESGLELFEMAKAVECAAEDQERPFFADQLDRGR